MRNHAVAVAVASIALLALTGCASGASSAPARSARTTDPPAASPSPTPTWSPTAPIGTPLGAGERVWAAFSHRGLSYDVWWAQLKPLLSEAAQAVYVYDDPSKIPEMSITGKIRVSAKAPGEARYTAEVLVPTSKGVFALELERHKIGSPWLLYAIKFPPTVR